MAELDEASARASWKCGGAEAVFACCDCKQARYCSKACQKHDWIQGGHKILCQGPPSKMKIHVILRELFLAEFAWLKSLDEADKEQLFHEHTRTVSINHLAIAGEVALVLARTSACAFLSNAAIHSLEFGTVYYNVVLFPWYEKHEQFLNEQGFVMEFIGHAICVADRLCPCRDENGEPCGQPSVLAVAAALFRDTRNPKNALVDKVFTAERSSKLDEWQEEEIVKHQDMMECISFALPQFSQGTKEESMVQYVFVHKGQVFGREDLCCWPFFVIRGNVSPSDAVALGIHFRKAREAMLTIGFSIACDIMNQEEWSDVAIGMAWFAAAKDIDTFAEWCNMGTVPFASRLDEDRLDNVAHSAFQRCVPAE